MQHLHFPELGFPAGWIGGGNRQIAEINRQFDRLVAQGAQEIGGTYSLELVEDGVADAVGDEVLADISDDVLDDGDVDGGDVAAGHGGGAPAPRVRVCGGGSDGEEGLEVGRRGGGGEAKADETDGELRVEI